MKHTHTYKRAEGRRVTSSGRRHLITCKTQPGCEGRGNTNTKRQLKLTAAAQWQPVAVFAALDKSQEPRGHTGTARGRGKEEEWEEGIGGIRGDGGSITLIKFVTTNANTTET